MFNYAMDMLKDYHRNGKYYLDKEKLAQAKAQLGSKK